MDQTTQAVNELGTAFTRTGTAAADAFGGLAALFESIFDATDGQSRKAFRLYKAFAIGEATAAAFLAANKALAGGIPPFSYVAAGAALAYGLANVARIASLDFNGGASSASASSSGGSSTQAFAEYTARHRPPQ